MVERVDSPMLDRQQRDELVASLQSIKLLWEEAVGVWGTKLYNNRNVTSSG